ncbi:MAG: PEGA domain-containing protein [Methanoregula sp.]
MSRRSGSIVILIAVFLAILLIVLPVSAVKVNPHATTITTLQITAIPTQTTVAVTPPTKVNPAANPTVSAEKTETTGSVMIYSSPTGASILIDGVYSGITPKTVNGISSGNHILRLELSRYYDYEGSVYVMPGQTVQGYGTLQPMSQVTSASTVVVPVIVPVVTVTPVPTHDPGLLGNSSVVVAIIGSVTVLIAAGVSIFTHLTPPKKG